MTASVLLLHSTEGGWEGSIAAFTANNSWPHEMFDPATGRRQRFIPLHQTAKALRNMTGGVETNRRESDGIPGPDIIQVEIVGYAGWMPDLPADQRVRLAEYVIDICAEAGIPIEFPLPFHGGEAYGLYAPTRLSYAAWPGARGVLGHQHVPENTHWDPGDIDWLPALVHQILTEEDMSAEAELQIANIHHWVLNTLNDPAHGPGGQPANVAVQFAAVHARLDALTALVTGLDAEEDAQFALLEGLIRAIETTGGTGASATEILDALAARLQS